jgi:phenylalanyl-tRNA synthetase beta chain
MVKIRNPLTEDQSVMRTNLVYSMLRTMKANAYSGCFDLKIFEIGRTFFHKNEGALPRERNRVGGLLTGQRYGDSWHFKELHADFYDLKGCIEGLFDSLKINNVSYSANAPETFLHPGRACNISVNEISLGWMGEIHPDVIERMDLRNRAMAFEIDTDLLSEVYSGKISFNEINKFPSSSRDVAFLVSLELEAEKIVTLSKGLGEELLEKVSVFDVYDGKGIPEGMKSLGLRFSYRASDRTLTDQEVNDVHGRIVKIVMTEYGAKIRGEEQS